MSNELVEIFGTIVHETDSAILLNDGDTEAWLPKSKIDYPISSGIGDDVLVGVEEWLAINAGFI